MSTTLIRRWKTEQEMTRAEARAQARALNRLMGDVPLFETNEWREHVEAMDRAMAAQRAQAERMVDEAQRAMGAAILDESSPMPARKRLEAARAELDALDQAHDELRRRHEDEAHLQRELLKRQSRARAYRWFCTYLTLAEEVLEARAALAAAEQRLGAIGPSARVASFRMAGISHEQSGLDVELLDRVPYDATTTNIMRLGAGNLVNKFRDTGRLTVEECRTLRTRAEQLLATEEAAAEGPPA